MIRTMYQILLTLIPHLAGIFAGIAAIVAAVKAQRAADTAQESKVVSQRNGAKLSNLIQAANSDEANTQRAVEINAGHTTGDRAGDVQAIDKTREKV